MKTHIKSKNEENEDIEDIVYIFKLDFKEFETDNIKKKVLIITIKTIHRH